MENWEEKGKRFATFHHSNIPIFQERRKVLELRKYLRRTYVSQVGLAAQLCPKTGCRTL
jgi:hypothetical protein